MLNRLTLDDEVAWTELPQNISIVHGCPRGSSMPTTLSSRVRDPQEQRARTATHFSAVTKRG